MHGATPEELEQYREEGFFYRERVFPEPELESLRRAAENAHRQILEAATSTEAPPTDRIDNQRYQLLRGSTIKWEWRDDLRAVRSMEPCHHLDRRLDALIDDIRLWRPCCEIIGRAELSLFSDKLNMKRPGGAPFPWHQEAPYWAYGAEQLDRVVSVLTYLDEATKENGCLWVIPGSHKLGTLRGLEARGVLGALYS
ncbi:MAG: phytanoyl-CoA dioxygenase family protein, partial [Myxococcota bacterium]